MWYNRIYETKDAYLKKAKVNLMYGPRRVGKTALIKHLLKDITEKVFLGDGDDIQLRKILSSNDKTRIRAQSEIYRLIGNLRSLTPQ